MPRQYSAVATTSVIKRWTGGVQLRRTLRSTGPACRSVCSPVQEADAALLDLRHLRVRRHPTRASGGRATRSSRLANCRYYPSRGGEIAGPVLNGSRRSGLVQVAHLRLAVLNDLVAGAVDGGQVTLVQAQRLGHKHAAGPPETRKAQDLSGTWALLGTIVLMIYARTCR